MNYSLIIQTDKYTVIFEKYQGIFCNCFLFISTPLISIVSVLLNLNLVRSSFWNLFSWIGSKDSNWPFVNIRNGLSNFICWVCFKNNKFEANVRFYWEWVNCWTFSPNPCSYDETYIYLWINWYKHSTTPDVKTTLGIQQKKAYYVLILSVKEEDLSVPHQANNLSHELSVKAPVLIITTIICLFKY